jgi:acid phosphatase family membrane protein YuiD
VTSWGLLILVAALALGLARERPGFHRYAIAFAIVTVVIVIAGARQHIL